MRRLLTALLLLIGTLGVVGCNPAEMTVEQLRVATPEELTKACQQGDAGACGYLGVSYDNGEGVAQDKSKAVELYQKACDGQFARNTSRVKFAGGCFNLGMMYEGGKGVKQDDFKAAEFYRKSCDGRNKFGCNNLGVMYEFGKGVRQSREDALKFFGKACDLKEERGCTNYARVNTPEK